jgi:hypothetical protein
MDEARQISGTPAPAPTGGLGDPSKAATGAAADETDTFAQAAAQIADLIRRFVEEVGGLMRDAQVAAESARTELADAARLRQELFSLRAESDAEGARILDAARAKAEAEAAHILDAARTEADAIRGEAVADAAGAKSVLRGALDDIKRAQETLAELVGTVRADVGERSQDVVVLPIAEDKTRAE